MNTLTNRRNIILIVTWIFMILILAFLSTPYESMAREVEMKNDLSINESPVQHSPKQKQPIAPFTIAIIGLSLGCMLIASSVHWNMTQRREVEAKIQGLDSFLASSCAVECRINGCNDNDPMINSVKDIQEKRDNKMKEYEEQKSVLVRSISDIEAEIMRIWG
jgi:hypothetical protein